MGRPIKRGSTDQSITIYIMDSTTGAPETGVDYNTSGIDLWYRRQGATKTSITEATLAALDSAHSDGGVEPISDGFYRLDLPDAACASAAGVNEVTVGGTITGMIVVGDTFPLVAYDPYDAVRMGMTALPNAAADAAGGLPISDAGALDLDAKLANTNEVTAARMGALTDWINGGRLDLILDIIAADTTTDIPATLATIAGYLDTEIAAVLADTNELQTDLVNGGRLDLLIDAIKAKTDSLTFTVAGDVDCNVQSWAGAAAPAMTGDAFARLGAPVGASVSADIAAVKVDTAATLADTGTDGVVVAAASKTGYTLAATTGLGNQTANITGNLSGSIGSVAAGGITAASIADAAIDAATFAADADAEIATMVWNAAAASYGGAGTYGQAVEDILADTNELQADDTPGALSALETHGDSTWATATGFSTHDAADVKTALEASGSVLWKALAAINNKMNVNESDGTVALRNIGDTGTIATGSVTSSSGTTTRLELTWA